MSIKQIQELLHEAKQLAHGAAQISIYEAAIRLADEAGLLQYGFNLRGKLIWSATHSGFQEKSLVAYSWCQAKFDAHPEELRDQSDLFMWQFKWIQESLPSFPQVTQRQIVDMQADMASRIVSLGYSLRPVHHMRWSNYMRMGQFEEAAIHIERWRAAPRDKMADCIACERHKYARFLVYTEKYEEAIEYAGPILAGDLTCSHIPHNTFALLIRPTLMLGRLDDACEMHSKGYDMISNNADFLSESADHLSYLVRAGDIDRGFTLFERHLPWALATSSLDRQFWFYTIAARFCEALAPVRDTFKMKTTPTFPLHNDSGEYNTTEVSNHFNFAALQLEEQFNQRNGNQWYSEVTRRSKVITGQG